MASSAFAFDLTAFSFAPSILSFIASSCDFTRSSLEAFSSSGAYRSALTSTARVMALFACVISRIGTSSRQDANAASSTAITAQDSIPEFR